MDTEAFKAFNLSDNATISENDFLHICTANLSKDLLLNKSTCDPSEASSSSTSLEDFKYVFIFGQMLFGMGASALITLGTTLLDESVAEKMAPVYIGIFESCFVLGPAIG